MFEKNTSMKVMKSISILTILIIMSSFANDNWVNFCSDTPGSPTVEVLSSNSTSTVLRIIIPGMNTEEKTVEGTTYKELRFLDRATMLDIGDPELPAVREFIAIPATADVTVSIIDNSEIIGLSDYNVYPFQTPLAEGEEAGPFDKNETRYVTDSFYPEEMIEVGEPEIMKDLRIVTLSVFPILFNPVTDSLRVYWDLTIELNYNGRNERNILTNQRDEISPASHRLYEKLISNYDFLNLTVRNLPSDYLIITPQEYFVEMQPFADWKNKSGMQTHIAVMPSACDMTCVKDTISSYYPDIDFVLIVGDEDDIPVYEEYEHYLVT